MKRLLAILPLFLMLPAFSQTSQTSMGGMSYMQVDKKPQYPGGDQALLQVFLDSVDFPRVRYNDIADSDIQAKVVLGFIIDEKGNVVDAKVIKSENSKLNNKLVTVARRLKFKPAIKDGKPVRAEYIFPFTFDFELR